MVTIVQPTFIDKYLNIGVRDDINKLFKTDKEKKVIDDIKKYQNIYNQKLRDPCSVNKLLENNIKEHINDNYNKINVLDADINYFIKGVIDSYNESFTAVISKMDISHIIKMLDYTLEKKINSSSKSFKMLMHTFYKAFYDQILLGLYGKTKKELSEQISDNWDKIKINNLFDFSNILSSLKYKQISTSTYETIFQNKLDNKENIGKLLDFVTKNYILSTETKESTITDINDVNDVNEEKKDIFPYKFRYIIENIKSNGFSLFEKYNGDVKSRYETINIDVLNKDLKLAKHFMRIIATFEQTNVNRYVNDMLINIRNYLFDLEESHYNNETYKKIKIRNESNKYKDTDITKYNRELTNFQINKYNYYNNENILTGCHKLSSDEQNNTLNYDSIDKNLQGYLDIYRSFYKTRYPDREIEYDLIDSNTIVKIKFTSGNYYIHMALIQYIVLDKIMKKDNISANEISESINIPLCKLNETFNSLLKIKIIKRTSGTNVLFALNKDFEFEKNKLSISGLVKKTIETKQVQREFMHDRNMIVLCNLVHYAKKNTYFSRDTIMEQLSYLVPFKLNDEYINKAIEKALEDDYIKIQEIPNMNGVVDMMYQYNDE
jgi:hypothetical protein